MHAGKAMPTVSDGDQTAAATETLTRAKASRDVGAFQSNGSGVGKGGGDESGKKSHDKKDG